MKSFRNTLLSRIIRAAQVIDARAERREAMARLKIDRAVGPKAVERAQLELKKLQAARPLNELYELRLRVARIVGSTTPVDAESGESPGEHSRRVLAETHKIMSILMRE